MRAGLILSGVLNQYNQIKPASYSAHPEVNVLQLPTSGWHLRSLCQSSLDSDSQPGSLKVPIWVSEWTSDEVLDTPVEAPESTPLLFLLCQQRHDFALRYNCEILHWEITAENKRTSVKFVLVQYSLMKFLSSFYTISWDSICW